MAQKSGNKWIYATIGGIAIIGFGIYIYIDFKNRNKTPKSLVVNPSSPETPFKNEAEGNAFRNWVNDNYPDYARSANLSRTGNFNDETMQKAFKQYGLAFNYRNGAATAKK